MKGKKVASSRISPIKKKQERTSVDGGSPIKVVCIQVITKLLEL